MPIQIIETGVADQINSCFGGTKTLHVNENIYSGHVVITKENYNLSNPIFFQLYGSDNVKSVAINYPIENLTSVC